MKKAILTISSEEYFPNFKILYESIKKHEPYVQIFLLTDSPYILDNVPSDVRILVPSEIKENYQTLNRKYNKADYYASLRPAFIKSVFDQGYEEIVLLGADCELFDSLTEIFIQFYYKTNCVLTPHITTYIPDDDKHPSYEDFSLTGQINSDVIGFRDSKETRQFLTWADKRLETKATRDKENGRFSDQMVFSYAQYVLPKTVMLTHPGYNTAYWNVMQRKLSNTVVFQYSGFDKEHPELMSKHQNRYVATGEVLELYKNYARRLG